MKTVPTSTTLNRNKIILILCDGMRADTAFEEFGYVNSICDDGIGIKTISIVDNPSVSRTNYETLHTGVPSSIHGITSNLITTKSKMDNNVFKNLTKSGKTTAIVGSSWFYDLYGKDKYMYMHHKEINKEDNEDITYGRFFSDDVPDSYNSNIEGLAHTFQLSDLIIYKYKPDYLLIHLVTPDKIGHTKGIGKEYCNEISKIDSVLGATLPRWLDMGYDIIITSDHGMDSNHSHGSNKLEVTQAPLYIISKKNWKPDVNSCKHTDIMSLILNRIK